MQQWQRKLRHFGAKMAAEGNEAGSTAEKNLKSVLSGHRRRTGDAVMVENKSAPENRGRFEFQTMQFDAD